ncbi:hypothetical protein [Nonomuraea maritima]|uniref:hypothetical protein n=1 Tax=Nonomuraea maritima TaxID=683260 RepID=UPI001C40B5F3|nr:hypothetical protein [Nonomuraea maritima]
MYFQGVHSYDALATGLAFLVPMAAIAVGSQAAGRRATRYGIRRCWSPRWWWAASAL